MAIVFGLLLMHCYESQHRTQIDFLWDYIGVRLTESNMW